VFAEELADDLRDSRLARLAVTEILNVLHRPPEHDGHVHLVDRHEALEELVVERSGEDLDERSDNMDI